MRQCNISLRPRLHEEPDDDDIQQNEMNDDGNDGGKDKPVYYMEEIVLLGTKLLVDSIRHFIRDPSGVFSVWHLCECHIVQWRHGLLLLNWFLVSRLFSLHIIKRTLHGGSKIWILSSRGKNNISLVRCAHSWDIVRSCHSNIKFISSRHRVISSMYLTRHTKGHDGKTLLFIHPNAWQSWLQRYGNEIRLLDATSKTAKYALPLFFVAVKTNVDYQIVSLKMRQQNPLSRREETASTCLQTISHWTRQRNLRRCQKQVGAHDCGLFAIANATTLANGVHPTISKLQQAKMKKHLKLYLENKKLTMFPHTESDPACRTKAHKKGHDQFTLLLSQISSWIQSF